MIFHLFETMNSIILNILNGYPEPIRKTWVDLDKASVNYFTCQFLGFEVSDFVCVCLCLCVCVCVCVCVCPCMYVYSLKNATRIVLSLANSLWCGESREWIQKMFWDHLPIIADSHYDHIMVIFLQSSYVHLTIILFASYDNLMIIYKQ